MATTDYSIFSSTYACLDFFPQLMYETRVGEHTHSTTANNVLGHVVVISSILLTPVTLVADVIIGLFEFALTCFKYDYQRACDSFKMKCKVGGWQQLVVMGSRIRHLVSNPSDWVGAYEASIIAALKLDSSQNFKTYNIFWDSGHREVFKKAGVAHPYDPPEGFTYVPPAWAQEMFDIAPTQEQQSYIAALTEARERPNDVLDGSVSQDYKEFRDRVNTLAIPTPRKLLGFNRDVVLYKQGLSTAYRKYSMAVYPDRNPKHKEEAEVLFKCLSTANALLEEQVIDTK